jgi:hypothetical protein
LYYYFPLAGENCIVWILYAISIDKYTRLVWLQFLINLRSVSEVCSAVKLLIFTLCSLCRLYTGIHALKPKNKSKSGAISESTTALNVDQSNTVLSESTHLASAALSTSSVAKALSTNSQDQNAALAPAAPKPHAAKVAVDKKRMDARKKSLKRL